jgi:hypothetical protein
MTGTARVLEHQTMEVNLMIPEERSAYWQQIIADQYASGLCGAAYCREHQINRDRFYHWRRRLRKNELAQFVQLVPYQKSSSGIRIHVNESISIEVEEGFHSLTLRQVMDTLVGPGSDNPCLP